MLMLNECFSLFLTQYISDVLYMQSAFHRRIIIQSDADLNSAMFSNVNTWWKRKCGSFWQIDYD